MKDWFRKYRLTVAMMIVAAVIGVTISVAQMKQRNKSDEQVEKAGGLSRYISAVVK